VREANVWGKDLEEAVWMRNNAGEPLHLMAPRRARAPLALGES
jgi:hypothetical protein